MYKNKIGIEDRIEEGPISIGYRPYEKGNLKITCTTHEGDGRFDEGKSPEQSVVRFVKIYNTV